MMKKPIKKAIHSKSTVVKKLKGEGWTPAKVKEFNSGKWVSKGFVAVKKPESRVVQVLEQVKKSIERALSNNTAASTSYGMRTIIEIIDRKIKAEKKLSK